jgi:phospholipid transport system substrate-binding protein
LEELEMRSREGLAAACIFACAPAAIHAQVADPAAHIGAYDDAVIAIMKQKLGLRARADRFETLVREYYDMPTIAQLVVGPKWSASSSADRSAATAALAQHSALQLARNFDAFDGEKFIVDPNVISRGANRIVRVTIVSRGSKDVLLYQLRQSAGGWKVVDVISGGVSQLAVQRSEAAAIVASGGPAALAQRLAKLDAVR